MSIKVMSNVWDKSPQKGSRLLLLLAIADYADDYGVAWPSVATLARKIRMSERHTKRMLAELEQGSLFVDRNQYHNHYVVLTGMSTEDLITSLMTKLGYSLQEARRAATSAMRRDSDKMSPLGSEESHIEDGDKLSSDGDNLSSDGDKLSKNGDTGVTQTVITTRTTNKPSNEGDDVANAPSHPASPEFFPEQFSTSITDIKAHDWTRKQMARMLEAEQARGKDARVTLVRWLKQQTGINQHPAIQAFREITHYYPPDAWRKKVADTVGENGGVERWRRTVEGWVGCGWNPRNVQGMLQFYRRGEIPGQQYEAAGQANARRRDEPTSMGAALDSLGEMLRGGERGDV